MISDLLCGGLTTRQSLWVILCCLPEKGRKEIVEEMKEGKGRRRNRNEREETEEIKTFPSTLTSYKDSKLCPTVSQYQMDALDTLHLRHTQPPHIMISEYWSMDNNKYG